MIEIPCEHGKFCMAFSSTDNEISPNDLFGERNFVEHFVCWSRNQTECG